MGYLLSLQTLERAESERSEVFASSWSTGICYSSTSTGLGH